MVRLPPNRVICTLKDLGTQPANKLRALLASAHSKLAAMYRFWVAILSCGRRRNIAFTTGSALACRA